MAANRLVFLGDGNEDRALLADALRIEGFDVVQTDQPAQVEIEFEHPGFSALIYVGQGGESLRLCQQLASNHPQVPVVYILDQQSGDLELSEHRIVCSPQTAHPRIIENLRQLIQLGRLHRRIHELSKMATGSTAIEKMFTKLDIHEILDKVLSYFGQRVEVDNIHWVRWPALSHMLRADKSILALELEVAEARSPRVMSLNQVDMPRFFEMIATTLRQDELEAPVESPFWIRNFEGRSILYVPVAALDGGEPPGLLIFESAHASDLSQQAPQIVESLHLMTRYIEFGLTHWDSKSLAMTDDLTDLYNQRYLPLVLDNEINRAQRRRTEFTVLFMDLDFFKAVNDTKGHWVGSKLLQSISGVLKRCVRSCDFAFRYGGDEFVVILPDTNIPGGQIVAERIRKSVESTSFLIEGHQLRITVSVGLASYPHHAQTREEIIQIADQAMYYGKRKSRNIVYVAS